MTQRTLRLKPYQTVRNDAVDLAEAVGLSSDDEVVTLRFMARPCWGEAAREVKLSKRLASDLSRLLNYELDVQS